MVTDPSPQGLDPRQEFVVHPTSAENAQVRSGLDQEALARTIAVCIRDRVTTDIHFDLCNVELAADDIVSAIIAYVSPLLVERDERIKALEAAMKGIGSTAPCRKGKIPNTFKGGFDAAHDLFADQLTRALSDKGAS